MKRNSIGILAGKAGSGKTIARRKAPNKLPQGQFQIVYVSLSTGSVLNNLNTIAKSFDLLYRHRRSQAWDAIREQINQL